MKPLALKARTCAIYTRKSFLQANQPRFLMLKHIRSIDIPLDWRAQRALFARYRAQ